MKQLDTYVMTRQTGTNRDRGGPEEGDVCLTYSSSIYHLLKGESLLSRSHPASLVFCPVH